MLIKPVQLSLLFDAVIRAMGDEPPTGPREVHLQRRLSLTLGF